MKTVTRSEISRSLGQTVFVRGKDYYERGKVASVEARAVEPDAVMLLSRVLGSDGSHYTQKIGLMRYGGFLDIDGVCSCPVGYNMQACGGGLPEIRGR